jgi:hypothetical protein
MVQMLQQGAEGFAFFSVRLLFYFLSATIIAKIAGRHPIIWQY